MNTNIKRPLIATLLLILVSPQAFSCNDDAAVSMANDVDALVSLFDAEKNSPDCG